MGGRQSRKVGFPGRNRPACGRARLVEDDTEYGGTLYDADVVDACLKLLLEEGL